MRRIEYKGALYHVIACGIQKQVISSRFRNFKITFLFSPVIKNDALVSKEYGCLGKKIAEYLRKNPAAVAWYVRKGPELRGEVEKVIQDQRSEAINSIYRSAPIPIAAWEDRDERYEEVEESDSDEQSEKLRENPEKKMSLGNPKRRFRREG